MIFAACKICKIKLREIMRIDFWIFIIFLNNCWSKIYYTFNKKEKNSNLFLLWKLSAWPRIFFLTLKNLKFKSRPPDFFFEPWRKLSKQTKQKERKERVQLNEVDRAYLNWSKYLQTQSLSLFLSLSPLFLFYSLTPSIFPSLSPSLSLPLSLSPSPRFLYL